LASVPLVDYDNVEQKHAVLVSLWQVIKIYHDNTFCAGLVHW